MVILSKTYLKTQDANDIVQSLLLWSTFLFIKDGALDEVCLKSLDIALITCQEILESILKFW